MALSISALALLQAVGQPARTGWGAGGGWWGVGSVKYQGTGVESAALRIAKRIVKS